MEGLGINLSSQGQAEVPPQHCRGGMFQPPNFVLHHSYRRAEEAACDRRYPSQSGTLAAKMALSNQHTLSDIQNSRLLPPLLSFEHW